MVHSSHSTLETSIVILRGMRTTFDVSRWFFVRIALSGLHQVMSTCKFRGRPGLLRRWMKIDGSLAQNIEF